MKRFRLSILFAVIMSMMGEKAFAHDIEEKNADGVTIYYKWINNKTELAVSYRGGGTNDTNRYSGNINIPESVTYEGVNYSVTSLGRKAFSECSSLTSVNIPNNVTSIGSNAFENCTSLMSVNIPNSVMSIGECAFRGCTSLTSINIPNSVTSVGSSAFHDCTGLTSITIPNSVMSIGSNAFYGCSGLTSFNIPNSVTRIEPGSFWNCTGLTSVTIPNSVTSIGYLAFSGCYGLTSINIPNSVTSIEFEAFYACIGLTTFTIPDSVKIIMLETFRDCSSLTSVTIGSGMSKVKQRAFSRCPKLTDVYCYASNVPEIDSDVFQDSHIEKATLHVPKGSKAAYKGADYWKEFKEIVEIGYLIGDANGDGKVDNSDINAIADYIIKGNTEHFIFTNADANGDQKVNVADIVCIVNIIKSELPAMSDNSYVDLGLPSGLLWATCNLGAEKPEQFGNYYDWASNPVHESWDDVWRTPTKDDRDELVNNCTYSLETINGVKGARYTGSNGKSIFFPFAGYYQSGSGPYKVGEGGQYWTTTEYSSDEHWIIGTNNQIQADNNAYYWPLYYFSFPVRPVTSAQSIK